MYIYTCAPTIESMLSCIYDAWSSKRGHKNIRLLLEPVEQYSFFDEYIHVKPDGTKMKSVMDAVNTKISPAFYKQLMYSSMAYEEDVLDNIFHCMILGFAFGPSALDMVQYRDIQRHQQICIRLGREINRFQEFIRFRRIGDVFVAHFEPKSRIAVALGPIFEDRMPSENWMIIDDIHKESVIHPKDQRFYMSQLGDLEYERLLETEQHGDDFIDLWKTFFNSVAIAERKNAKCQDNLAPKWTRKHMPEFN